MRQLIQDPSIGEIVYEESFWTGKKKIYINGKMLEKTGKTSYLLPGEEMKTVYVNGNIMTGVSVIVDGRRIQVISKPLWYETAIAILIFAFNIVWGNSVQANMILPLVGGAIGGLISGAIAMTALLVMKKTDKVWQKLLYGIGLFIASIVICSVVAILLLSMLV